MAEKKSNRARSCPRKREHALGFAKFLPGEAETRGSVGVRDVAFGIGAGLAGSIGLKWAVKQAGVADKLPAFVNRFWPAVSGVATGLALYALEKKGAYGKAKAHLIGASLAGLTISAWDALKAQFPDLADLVSLQLSDYRGVLVDDSRYAGYRGMLVDDNSNSARNLAELNGINMSDVSEEEEFDVP